MGMTTTSPRATRSNRWLLHDVLLGILAGAGAGGILGLIAAVRISDSNLITLAGAILGAIIAVYALLRSHRSGDRFLTPTTIVSWVVLAGAATFIGSLANAIVNFN